MTEEQERFMAAEVDRTVDEHLMRGIRTIVAAGVDSVSATLAYSDLFPERDLTVEEKEAVRRNLWANIESKVVEIANEK